MFGALAEPIMGQSGQIFLFLAIPPRRSRVR